MNVMDHQITIPSLVRNLNGTLEVAYTAYHIYFLHRKNVCNLINDNKILQFNYKIKM